MINVTETYLPSRDSYDKYLNYIWENKWLTNGGKLNQKLNSELQAYLSSTDLILTNNGTIPLQIALKVLGRKGDIITTPFSYIATSSAIVWEDCTPVFVDIDPDYLTIDEKKIEAAISDRTTAILATHVFGNPCAVDEIEHIAKKHNLQVIYDAAHCFGVTYQGQSVFNYGDVSTCSFHATKIFHTGEGGALFCKDQDLLAKCRYHGNFGHNGQYDYHGLGVNAKMSELHAAMGLSVLAEMEQVLEGRKKVVDRYRDLLDPDISGTLKIRKGTQWNYSYFPIIFDSEKTLQEVIKSLETRNIFGRRYFYPSLNTINYLSGQQMPVAESVSRRVLCLPLYVGLPDAVIEEIATVVNGCLAKPVTNN
ncbi:MAG: DegT/DnrJ/EryC1/StrS family aminotransferase [Bacteroidota bacterium]